MTCVEHACDTAAESVGKVNSYAPIPTIQIPAAKPETQQQDDENGMIEPILPDACGLGRKASLVILLQVMEHLFAVLPEMPAGLLGD